MENQGKWGNERDEAHAHAKEHAAEMEQAEGELVEMTASAIYTALVMLGKDSGLPVALFIQACNRAVDEMNRISAKHGIKVKRAQSSTLPVPNHKAPGHYI